MTPSARPDPWALVPPIASWVPEYDYTLGPEFAEVATMAGLAPDPEQQLILDAAGAVKNGKSAARDVGVCAPRQNLKTGSLKQLSLGWIFVLELPLVTWTAHLTSTSSESFRDMIELIESCPDLDNEVMKVSHSNGEEGFEFSGGRRLAFRARTKGGSRGVTGNRVIFDESMYETAAHLAALAPTLRAVPDPQIVHAGSAGFADSHVWRALRDRGRAGGDRFLAWLEWAASLTPGGCVEERCKHDLGTPGCALDDDELLLRSNSALGRRMELENLHADRLLMAADPLKYAVETLGWWEDPAGLAGIFDMAKWDALKDEKSRRAGDVVLAFDIDPDRTQGSIGLFGERKDGLGHTELIEHGYGTAWIVPRLKQLQAKHKPRSFVVGGQAPAAALIPELIKAGFEVVDRGDTNAKPGGLVIATQTDFARACGAYLDAHREGGIRHIGQPLLTASVGGVTLRTSGDAAVYNRRGGQDITAACAVTLARWGFMSTKPTGELTEEQLRQSAY